MPCCLTVAPCHLLQTIVTYQSRGRPWERGRAVIKLQATGKGFGAPAKGQQETKAPRNRGSTGKKDHPRIDGTSSKVHQSARMTSMPYADCTDRCFHGGDYALLLCARHLDVAHSCHLVLSEHPTPVPGLCHSRGDSECRAGCGKGIESRGWESATGRSKRGIQGALGLCTGQRLGQRQCR